MSNLTESDIIQRHVQALREGHRACQKLGYNADPEYLALRGRLYADLKAALDVLEGSCRQLSHWRSDARWLRLGILYAKTMRVAQKAYVGQRWARFTELMPLFENGLRSMEDLKDRRTGVLSSNPILPQRASEWLVLPDYTPAVPSRIRVH